MMMLSRLALPCLLATLTLAHETPPPSYPEPPAVPSTGATAPSGACQIEFMPWEVFFAGGTKTVVADGGLEATVTHYSVGHCDTFYFAPTGGNVGGRTALSYNITMSADTTAESHCCALRTDTPTPEFVSFQAIVVRTPGWTMRPRQLRVLDVDAHAAAGAVAGAPSAWREVAGVFGLRGSEVVAPALVLNGTAALEAGEAALGAAAAAEMGIAGAAGAEFPTVRFASDSFHDCAWSEAAKCEAAFDFGAPIDTLVVLVSITEKTLAASFGLGGVLVGKVASDCGCRCSLVDGGVRTIHAPVPGEANWCVKKTSEDPITKCDPDGANWCETRDVLGWVATGPPTQDGKIPCETVPRVAARYLHPYDP